MDPLPPRKIKKETKGKERYWDKISDLSNNRRTNKQNILKVPDKIALMRMIVLFWQNQIILQMLFTDGGAGFEPIWNEKIKY